MWFCLIVTITVLISVIVVRREVSLARIEDGPDGDFSQKISTLAKQKAEDNQARKERLIEKEKARRSEYLESMKLSEREKKKIRLKLKRCSNRGSKICEFEYYYFVGEDIYGTNMGQRKSKCRAELVQVYLKSLDFQDVDFEAPTKHVWWGLSDIAHMFVVTVTF